MNGTPKKPVRGSDPHQKKVWDAENLNYIGPKKAQESESVSGDVRSARSDFSSEVQDDFDYPELDYPKAEFDTIPDMDYLLNDPDYMDEMRDYMGIEDDEDWEPELDYSSPMVQSQIEMDIEWGYENVQSVAQEWFDNLDEDDDDSEYILIEGEGMGWRSLSGHRVMRMEDFLDNPVKSIQPNTQDISQRWSNDKGTLTATQSHHDAQGEKYTFTPINEERAQEYGYGY